MIPPIFYIQNYIAVYNQIFVYIQDNNYVSRWSWESRPGEPHDICIGGLRKYIYNVFLYRNIDFITEFLNEKVNIKEPN